MFSLRALVLLILTGFYLGLNACGGGGGGGGDTPTIVTPTYQIKVSPISKNTDESGATATFTVVLSSQPTNDVTIPVSSSDPTEGTVDQASLTFTAADWSQVQTVTVTGVYDDLADGNVPYTIVLGAAISTDFNYNGKDPADVTVTNLDVRVAAFIVSPVSGTTSESGATFAFQVRLGTPSSANVTIPVSSQDPSEGTVDQASLIFTSTNWNVDQTVTVTGVSDNLADGDVIYLVQLGAVTSADVVYNGLDPADVSVTNTDVRSAASFEITTISGNTSESGTTATFQVRLGSQPTFDVTIPLSSLDTTEGTVSPTSLVFTNLNWNVYQTITVTGVSDNLADGDVSYLIRLGAVTSTDVVYNGQDPADVSVTNTDVRSASFEITTISGNTSESGTTATFQVRLGSQPTFDVTIPLSSLDTTEGTVSPTSLDFTNLNWNDYQIVTVTGVDDAVADGNISYTIQLGLTSSTDSVYDGVNPPDVAVTNVDLVDAYGVTPKVSAGDYHNLVLANDGTVWGWGNNGSSQLDVTPTGAYIDLPRKLNIPKVAGIAGTATAADVAAGYAFSLIAKQDGTIWSSGENTNSQLGHHSGTTPYTTLSPVLDGSGQPFSGATKVAAGAYHSLGLKNDGTVWGWGKNAQGQLGNGVVLPGANSVTPVQATSALLAKTVTAISAGQDHSMALAGGQVFTWGSDSEGQLGNGASISNLSTPAAVGSTSTFLTGATIIAAGQLHSLANGTYAALDSHAWGDNAFRQLGTSVNDKAVPDPILGIIDHTVTKLTGAFAHSLALWPNGDVYGWGDNSDEVAGTDFYDNRGALGDASTINRITPVLTRFGFTYTGSVRAIDISGGGSHSLAVLADGRLRTSGKNTSYQLGSSAVAGGGPNDFQATPVYVLDHPVGSGSFYAYRPILAGYPATSTTSNAATIQVCPNTLVAPANCGPITHYTYSTNNGTTWSVPSVIATPISLSGLPTGTVNLLVRGMTDASTYIQSHSTVTNFSAASVSWTVN